MEISKPEKKNYKRECDYSRAVFLYHLIKIAVVALTSFIVSVLFLLDYYAVYTYLFVGVPKNNIHAISLLFSVIVALIPAIAIISNFSSYMVDKSSLLPVAIRKIPITKEDIKKLALSFLAYSFFLLGKNSLIGLITFSTLVTIHSLIIVFIAICLFFKYIYSPLLYKYLKYKKKHCKLIK